MSHSSLVLLVVVMVSSFAAATAQITCKVDTAMGCYTDLTYPPDNPVRALFWGAFSPPEGASWENCAAYCQRFPNHTLIAVEFGTQCFCGDALNPAAHSAKVADSDCNMPCAGNSSQICGAADRMNLYNATCTGTALPSYQGCSSDLARGFPYCNMDLSIAERVEDLLSRLTLDQKISMISPQPQLGDTCGVHTAGIDSLGIPQYYWLVETNTGVASACMSDTLCSTTFSGPLGMAASFNRTNWRNKGLVFGMEMRAHNNAGFPRFNPSSSEFIGLTGYGPNINIARDPRFGRTSELPGEDPFLSGTYAAEMVQGMQTEDSNGHPLMLAYLKHYTAYSRETDRGHDSYNISTHDFFDTYLAQYEIAFVKGKATGAMCSYNAENGVPSCANDFILNQVIRTLWNRPDAHITTDCGAVSNMRGFPANAPSDAHAAAWTINNGTDLEMGSTVWTTALRAAVDQGLTTEDAINTSFRRAYTQLFRAGRFDPLDSIEWSKIGTDAIGAPRHKQIQFEAALQSFVLLKNDKNVLPLKKGTSVAVLGPLAVSGYSLLSDYFGDEVCFGGGYDCITTIAQGINQTNTGGTTTWAAGVDINSNNDTGIAPAMALAEAADVIILALGIDKSIECEGTDREDTALPGLQEPFAQKVLSLGKPTILILCNGGALAIDNLISGPAAIIEAYNPSIAGAKALGATLFGDYNRWGRLVTTLYPHSFITENPMTNYDMSLAPGRTYRYYTGTPLFPFGAGMSYSTMNLSCQFTGVAPSGDREFTCGTTNNSPVDGDQVVLAYHAVGDAIRKRANHPIPLRALVEFDRVSVPAGEYVEQKFSIPESRFGVVNGDGDRVVYNGQHSITFSQGNGEDVTLSFYVSGGL